jgi:hypothetical protein
MAANVDIDMTTDIDIKVYDDVAITLIYLWANIKSGLSSLADDFWLTNYFNPTHIHFQNSAHFLNLAHLTY